MNKNYDMTQPMVGWIRLTHVETGQTIDMNPANREHKILLEQYLKNPKWRQTNYPQ